MDPLRTEQCHRFNSEQFPHTVTLDDSAIAGNKFSRRDVSILYRADARTEKCTHPAALEKDVAVQSQSEVYDTVIETISCHQGMEKAAMDVSLT